MKKNVVEVEFGKIEVIDNYIVHTANEGVDIGHEELQVIDSVIDEHIVGDVGYISNQVNDYSISAVHVAMFIMNKPRIKHIAFVSYEKSLHTAFNSVLRLLPDNVFIKTFPKLGQAHEWMKECLPDYKSVLNNNSAFAAE